MAKPTMEQVFDQARALLGDDSVAGGTVFTDTVLLPHVGQAVRELFRVLRGTTDPFVLDDGFYMLPPNTEVLDPATAGLTNFATPEFVEWQLGSNTTYSVTNVVVGTVAGAPAATVTAAGIGSVLLSGATIVMWGAGGFDFFNNPNNIWVINVIDANNITLNGCTATGTYTNGGTIAPVTGQFVRMQAVDFLDGVPQSAGQLPLTTYAWEGGVIKTYPAAQPMLLRLVYRTSGVAPSTPAGIVPFDDCQDYLATRAAGLAASAKGAGQLGQRLTVDAIGPEQPDGNGGLLRQLVQISVRNMQRQQFRHQAFRERRNRNDFILW